MSKVPSLRNAQAGRPRVSFRVCRGICPVTESVKAKKPDVVSVSVVYGLHSSRPDAITNQSQAVVVPLDSLHQVTRVIGLESQLKAQFSCRRGKVL